MFDQLCSWENLLKAYRKASKGKRGKPNTAAFEYKLEANLLQLQDELKSKTYQPGSYHSFYIHEPKRRLISAAPFRDRVVHHALCNLLEPIFDRSFIHESYANRTGKGTHRAIDQAQRFSRKYTYFLQCDIRQFFPSIDHEILLNLIRKKIACEQVLWLVKSILRSGEGVLSSEYEMVYYPGDSLLAAFRPRGLPIGNLTSQFWANIYLNPFDHFVKRELGCGGYLRYVDDFILFANDKQVLWEWKHALVSRLHTLRLALHVGACPQPVKEGFTFLGFRVFPQNRRLKKQNGIAFQRKLAVLKKAHLKNEIKFDQLSASITGWVNHARYGNTIGLRKKVLNMNRTSNNNSSSF